MAYRDIGKRADAELPKLFAELPRVPYGIRRACEALVPEARLASASIQAINLAQSGSFSGRFLR